MHIAIGIHRSLPGAGDSVAASGMDLGVAGRFWPPPEVQPLRCALFDDVSSLVGVYLALLQASSPSPNLFAMSINSATVFGLIRPFLRLDLLIVAHP
jgi:hypothetical protein